MQWILAILVVAMIAVALVVYFDDEELGLDDEEGYEDESDSNELQASTKHREANLLKILEYLEKHDEVTNDDIEAILDVSNATVTRYFDELEKRGEVKQIGTTGRGVFYKKIHR